VMIPQLPLEKAPALMAKETVAGIRACSGQQILMILSRQCGMTMGQMDSAYGVGITTMSTTVTRARNPMEDGHIGLEGLSMILAQGRDRHALQPKLTGHGGLMQAGQTGKRWRACATPMQPNQSAPAMDI